MVCYVASQLTSSLNLLSILVTNICHYSYSTLYTFFFQNFQGMAKNYTLNIHYLWSRRICMTFSKTQNKWANTFMAELGMVENAYLRK